jgi:hypothetical protein
MSWRHRIVHRTYTHKNGEIEHIYGIHECYTDPYGWTENPVDVSSDTVEGLRWVLEHMLKALDEPIIEGGECHQN